MNRYIYTGPANTSQWTRENIAWLAGLLEGEGCFAHYRLPDGTLRLTIAVSMTDEDVVRKAWAIAGAGQICGPMKSRRNPEHKPFWRVNVVRQKHVYALCVALYPFMGARRAAKIEDMIRAWKAEAAQKVKKRRRWMPARGSWSAAANTELWG